MQGVGLSVTPVKQDCLLELHADVGQLAALRRILDICRQDFSLSFERTHEEPELFLESEPYNLPSDTLITLTFVGPAKSGKKSLINYYIGGEVKSHLPHYVPILTTQLKKIQLADRQIQVQLRQSHSMANFKEYARSEFSLLKVIILTVNLKNEPSLALKETQAIFNSIVSHADFSQSFFILVGTHCEARKVSQEVLESFAESLGMPYIECSFATGMNISTLFDLALRIAIGGKRPRYHVTVLCKNVSADFFRHPEFYHALSQKIFEEKVPSSEMGWAPQREVYRRAVKYLETHKNYFALLKFHARHYESRCPAIRQEAGRVLTELPKTSSVWIQSALDELKYELEGNHLENKKDTILVLQHINFFIGFRIYNIALSIEPNSIEIVCEFLKDNQHIVTLTLSVGITTTDEMFERVISVLKTCTSLRRLVFESGTRLQVKDFKSFKSIFETHPSLVSLDFSQCGLSDDSIVSMAEVLQCNTTLHSLNLSEKNLSGKMAGALKELVQNNQGLTRLVIANGHMAFNELSKVVEKLYLNRFLTELNLSRNSLSEVAVENILKSCAENPSLKLLDVSYCSLTYAGMSALLRGLSLPSRLTSVHLAGYDFHKNNIAALSEVILKNNVLLFLGISECYLDLASLKKILISLAQNVTLRKINFSRNALLDDGAHEIASFFRSNKSLTSVDISETRMTDDGLIALSEALTTNTVLGELLMRKNTYTQAGVSVLLAALEKNTGLYALDIGESIENKEVLESVIGFIPDNRRIRILGCMPPKEKRTVEMLALYENAFMGNTIITHTRQDFKCRCGRCLCVKARGIVQLLEENRFNRYKNMALLIKAYLNPDEDSLSLMAFKKIPKDVLLYIFKRAYPELPEKVFNSVSRLLFFKPQERAVPAVQQNIHRFKKQEYPSVSRVFPFLGLTVTLKEEKDGVRLSLSSSHGDMAHFRRLESICHEKLPLILPYHPKSYIEFKSIERESVLNMPHVNEDDEFLFRIAVMGEVAAGKTILVNRFANNTYHDQFKATIGVDFKEKTMRMGNARCKLQVWDLAGTRRHDTMTSIYLRETAGIILAVDLRRPEGYEETYERILQESDFPNIPVLLVGLKADLYQKNIPLFEEIACHLNLPSITVSSRTGENVEKTFELMTKMILTQQFPGCAMRWHIHKATLEWFNLPCFFSDLNQFLSEEVGCVPRRNRDSFKHELYRGAVEWLKREKDKIRLLRFYIKHATHDEDFIRRDAAYGVEQFKREYPELLNNLKPFFINNITTQNNVLRREAIEGLRFLGELSSQKVKIKCLAHLKEMKFEQSEYLKQIIEKKGEYKKSELVKACLRAISAAHATCFDILEESGAIQECKEISARVLQIFQDFLKPLPSVSSLLPFRRKSP